MNILFENIVTEEPRVLEFNPKSFERPERLTVEWFLQCFGEVIRPNSVVADFWLNRLSNTLERYEQGELTEIDLELYYALYKASSEALTGGSNRIDLLEIDFLRKILEVVAGLREVGINVNFYLIDEAGISQELEGIDPEAITYNWQLINDCFEAWGCSSFAELLTADLKQVFSEDEIEIFLAEELAKFEAIDFGSEYRFMVRSMEDMLNTAMLEAEVATRRSAALNQKCEEFEAAMQLGDSERAQTLKKQIQKLEQPPSNTEFSKIKKDICTEVAKKFMALMALRSRMNLADSTVQLTVSPQSPTKLSVACSPGVRNPNYGRAYLNSEGNLTMITQRELPSNALETPFYILES